MVKYTTEQRVFIVETYLSKKKSYDKCVQKFLRRFPEATLPSKPYVRDLFKKWRETGSILNKKRRCEKRVLTEETLEDMRARIAVSPRKPSRRLAQECGISQSSVLRGLKNLNFRKKKISVEVGPSLEPEPEPDPLELPLPEQHAKQEHGQCDTEDVEAALLHLRLEKLLFELEKLSEERECIKSEKRNIVLRSDILQLRVKLMGFAECNNTSTQAGVSANLQDCQTKSSALAHKSHIDAAVSVGRVTVCARTANCLHCKLLKMHSDKKSASVIPLTIQTGGSHSAKPVPKTSIKSSSMTSGSVAPIVMQTVSNHSGAPFSKTSRISSATPVSMQTVRGHFMAPVLKTSRTSSDTSVSVMPISVQTVGSHVMAQESNTSGTSSCMTSAYVTPIGMRAVGSHVTMPVSNGSPQLRMYLHEGKPVIVQNVGPVFYGGGTDLPQQTAHVSSDTLQGECNPTFVSKQNETTTRQPVVDNCSVPNVPSALPYVTQSSRIQTQSSATVMRSILPNTNDNYILPEVPDASSLKSENEISSNNGITARDCEMTRQMAALPWSTVPCTEVKEEPDSSLEVEQTGGLLKKRKTFND